jgi:hypothetical protein
MSQDEEIVRHEAGTAKLEELNTAIRAAWWEEIVAQPDELKKAADALGVRSADLKKLAEPPVAAHLGRAGLTGGDILIVTTIWIGNEIVLGSLKDLAKEELKRRFKKLWSDVLERAVRNQLKDRRYGMGRQVEGKTKEHG